MGKSGNRGNATYRSNTHEKRIRDARANLYSEFSNQKPSNSIEELSQDLLDCSRCGLRKPDGEFHRNKTKAYRRCRSNTCKVCCKELQAKRWRKLSPEQREKHRKSCSDSYKKNADKAKEWQKKYNERNAEKIKNQKKKYREKNRVLLRKKALEYYYSKKEQKNEK